MREISFEEADSLLGYKDGKLIWKHRPSEMFSSQRIYKSWNSRYAGTVAGCKRGDCGYYVITVKRVSYCLHRIVFLLTKGYLPALVDHIDGNPSNNLCENLREATFRENQYNRKVGKNSKSGVKGVYWNSRNSLWAAQIISNGKHTFIGEFEEKEDAEKAYINVSRLLHGEFSTYTRDGIEADECFSLERIKSRGKRLSCKNSSGRLGVTWSVNTRGNTYAKSFYHKDGKQINKYFSVLKLGLMKAFRDACQFRDSSTNKKSA